MTFDFPKYILLLLQRKIKGENLTSLFQLSPPQNPFPPPPTPKKHPESLFSFQLPPKNPLTESLSLSNSESLFL